MMDWIKEYWSELTVALGGAAAAGRWFWDQYSDRNENAYSRQQDVITQLTQYIERLEQTIHDQEERHNREMDLLRQQYRQDATILEDKMTALQMRFDQLSGKHMTVVSELARAQTRCEFLDRENQRLLTEIERLTA